MIDSLLKKKKRDLYRRSLIAKILDIIILYIYKSYINQNFFIPEKKVLREVDHVEKPRPSPGEDVAREGYGSSVVLE